MELLDIMNMPETKKIKPIKKIKSFIDDDKALDRAIKKLKARDPKTNMVERMSAAESMALKEYNAWQQRWQRRRRCDRMQRRVDIDEGTYWPMAHMRIKR
ncbi:hypothetical protein ES703_35275 [subsurface metagenome]